MQLFAGLVTLGLLISGCATGHYAHLSWAELAGRSGDKVELLDQIKRLEAAESTSLKPYLLGLRLNANPPVKTAQQRELLGLSSLNSKVLSAQFSRLAAKPQLRRPVLKALLQAGLTKEAKTLIQSPHEALLVALVAGDAERSQALWLQSAKSRKPSDEAVRDLALARRLVEPQGTKASRLALEDLSERRSPGQALKTLKNAPANDCLAAIVGGLALEELGQPAAAAEHLQKGDCATAKAHWARLSLGLAPNEARLQLEDVLKAEPLNVTALRATLIAYGPDDPRYAEAEARLVAWWPADRTALAAQVTREERESRWLEASSWLDRSLRFAWDEELHAQSLALLARAGAARKKHPRKAEFEHRLKWLRTRRQDLATSIDLVVQGKAPVRPGLRPTPSP